MIKYIFEYSNIKDYCPSIEMIKNTQPQESIEINIQPYSPLNEMKIEINTFSELTRRTVEAIGNLNVTLHYHYYNHSEGYDDLFEVITELIYKLCKYEPYV